MWLVSPKYWFVVSYFTSCSLTVPTDPVRRCWRWDDPGCRIVAEDEEAELREWEEVWRAASSILSEALGGEQTQREVNDDYMKEKGVEMNYRTT